MYARMLELYQMHFPLFAEKTVNSKDVGNGLLFVELVGGDKYIFDMYDKYIHRLPQDPNNMTDEECRREFGMRLERLMRLKCMTQTELAMKTNISQYLISNYITGKTSPGFYNLDKIARALDCSIDEFRYV